jgi:nucleoside-diphosphate-sugar epimerase
VVSEPGVVLPAALGQEVPMKTDARHMNELGAPASVEDLEAMLADPTDALVADLAALDGDIMILGAGGKIGPTVARMAATAMRKAGSGRQVYAVARFSSPELPDALARWRVRPIVGNLLDHDVLRDLPDVPSIVFMAGTKFGTAGNEPMTWAMNAYLPGQIAHRFPQSRVVVFSTGNVYPFTPIVSGGATEEVLPAPVGEYAQSCLGRERVFEYFSRLNGTPTVILRLNYAVDLRYGILVDVAQAVMEGRPIDLRMGAVNVIWQRDAAEVALRCLTVCQSPPLILNVTGPETIAVRWLAEEFGTRFGVAPVFEHDEQGTALLSNASRTHRLFGYPNLPLLQLVDWTAGWLKAGGMTLGKPTHFQHRDGRF